MTRFEPWISGIRIGHSTNSATTNSLAYLPRSLSLLKYYDVNNRALGRPYGKLQHVS